MAFLDEDLLNVTIDAETESEQKIVIAFGDRIDILGDTDDGRKHRVRLSDGTEAIAAKGFATRESGIFRFSLVDVQQGDGMVLESPSGRLVLIDGGDNELFARYLAARFSATTAEFPLTVEALVVTHGDADHFAGLADIAESEKLSSTRKRLFLRPLRLYHNGIIKGPVPAAGQDPLRIFGASAEVDGQTYIVELEDDFLAVPDERMNRPFKAWKRALEHWEQMKPEGIPKLECKRLELGMENMFAFFAEEGVQVEILGPSTTNIPFGERDVPALPWLHEPGRSFEGGISDRLSDSHTINGHSITLKITVGNVRLLLGGDLNAESLSALLTRVGPERLRAEVVKVPHHGSADFDFDGLRAMNPFIWLISSGDESSRKEYIHPRADLMGSLGAASRDGIKPLIFCTELAAFFEVRGLSETKAVDQETGQRRAFFGFERTNFGIVHVRTDGERLLVFTHSGKAGMKEAYAYTVNADHEVKAQKVRKK